MCVCVCVCVRVCVRACVRVLLCLCAVSSSECAGQIINHESTPWDTDYKDDSWHGMDSLHTRLPSITDPAASLIRPMM